MRTLTVLLMAMPLAGIGLAQTPAPTPVDPATPVAPAASVPTPRQHAPVLQTASFDVAAAFEQHYRAMIEPLVFGRFAIGVSGDYTTEAQGGYYSINYPSCPPTMLCSTAAAADGSEYRAWSFNLHGRWYPAALSLGGQRQSLSIYLGEFIGYHERRSSVPLYYGCPNCYAPQPADTTVYPPNPYYPGPSTFEQVLHGWEPGVEFGVRLLPMRHIVMDLGASFRLATIEDFHSGIRPGAVDSRLVIAVGAAW